MTDLYLHNHKIESVFQMLGDHENDISFSVAWALAKCSNFLDLFLKATGYKPLAEKVLIKLQHFEKHKSKTRKQGITDVEIESPGKFHIIVETKKGWTLPNRSQLEKYANRISFKESQAPEKLILVISECRDEYAYTNLEVNSVSGIRIKHMSWQTVAKLARTARSKGNHSEKRLLGELLIYLEGLISMTDIYSNMVFIVALGSKKPDKWDISWIDIVKKRKRYFHPVGSGWPKDPPNYIGFRYFGKLQSIHHIERYDIFTNPNKIFPEIPEKEWDPHFLYFLGPAIIPPNEIRSENIRNRHDWCMFDTLFISDTISKANKLTKTRVQRYEKTEL